MESLLNYINTSIMKRIITLFVLLTTTLIYSQSSGITYQAVIYIPGGQNVPGVNVSNVPMTNKSICLQFSLLDANNRLEYQEEVKVKTDEFGMVISSFLIVRTRVTKRVFSKTTPVVSPILILSPILKGRIYVITNPATILAMADDEPRENRIPIKTETPLKTLDSEPGRYGKISTTIKAYKSTLTIP